VVDRGPGELRVPTFDDQATRARRAAHLVKTAEDLEASEAFARGHDTTGRREFTHEPDTGTAKFELAVVETNEACFERGKTMGSVAHLSALLE
jgi:hypothetical protein